MPENETPPTTVLSNRLEGRRAIVTGSTSGIGEAIALALAGAGARVVVSGRNEERGAATVEAIRGAGGQAEFVTADLGGSYADVRAFAADASSALGGGVDILVNNAGIYPVSATPDLADTDLDAMLAVNIRAPHVLVGELVPAMAERGSGVVVNIGSWMAYVGSPFGAMYTATKAADEQLVRSWAAEYGPRGVRFAGVAPGATATAGNAESHDVLAQMTAATPAGAPVSPEDIAAAVAYVVSDEARMVQGSTLFVDGGITFTRMG